MLIDVHILLIIYLFHAKGDFVYMIRLSNLYCNYSNITNYIFVSYFINQMGKIFSRDFFL